MVLLRLGLSPGTLASKFPVMKESGTTPGLNERPKTFREYLAIIVAFLAAAFTGWQGCEARRARIDTEDAAKQAQIESARALNEQLAQAKAAVAEAQRAAVAAERTADIQNQILFSQHRGYVGLESVTLETLPKPITQTHLPAFQFKIRAYGSAPALDVDVDAKCASYPWTEKPPMFTKILPTPKRDLPPGETQSFTCRPLDLANWPEGLTSIRTARLEGLIRYQDIFHRPHLTRFCYDTSRWNAEKNGVDLLPCTDGNRME